MDVRSVTLTAGTVHRFEIPGRFFMLISTEAELTVRFTQNGSPTREVARDVERGYFSEPGNWADPDDRFDGYELESATNQTVRVAVSDRKGGYSQTLPEVKIEQADDFESTADAAVTTTVGAAKIASNANRRKLVIQHVGGAGVVRLGDDAITASRGAQLQPGGSYTIHSTAAVFARTESGTATISFLEEVVS